MTAIEAQPETPVTFPAAARTLALGVGWRKLRDWCRAAGVALDYGGGRTRVLPSEARRVVLSRRVAPTGRKAARRARPYMAAGEVLDPAVRC